MILKMFRDVVGNMDMFTNIYVVADEKTKEAMVIDPGGAVSKVVNYIENLELKLRYIVLTHCHTDHTAGVKELLGYYPNAKVAVHEADATGLNDSQINMCDEVGKTPRYIEPDIVLKEDDIVSLGELKAKILHTPGHTAGGICILINDAMFTGDTLFKKMYGRTDLPTGSDSDMQFSIQKILSYPDNTILYPGHGAISIIREEREHYQFVENGIYVVEKA